MGVSDKLRKVGDFVRKNWRSTADDSYREYERERERERKQADGGVRTHNVLLSRSAGRQSGSMSTKSAMRPNAQPRSPNRRRLGMTRANPNHTGDRTHGGHGNWAACSRSALSEG